MDPEKLMYISSDNTLAMKATKCGDNITIDIKIMRITVSKKSVVHFGTKNNNIIQDVTL